MKKTKRRLPLPTADDELDLFAGHWAPVLLAWYDAHHRDLPWRTPAPRDPYRVWVSEIMLQQTKVEAARGYYLRWMEHFPDIAAWPRPTRTMSCASGRAWATIPGPATCRPPRRKS